MESYFNSLLLITVILLSFWTMTLARYHMTIIAPERGSTENDLRQAMASASNRFVSSSISFIDKNNPTPNQTIEVFCDEVFKNNASVIFSINYEQETSRASDFIVDIASRLGYPVISWDPFYQGALEVSNA